MLPMIHNREMALPDFQRDSVWDYFAEIRAKHGIDKAATLLESHLLPTWMNSPLLQDDFEGFLTQREHALLLAISCETGKSLVQSHGA